jgi:hypothetical protein
MRALTALSLSASVLLVACGEKAPPTPAPVAAAAEAAAPPAPEPEPEPAPPPAPAEVINADFNVSITKAGGETVSGHVKRVERSENFLGDTEWLTEASDLKLAAEGPGTYKKLAWSEIQSITVKPEAANVNNMSCTYSSDYNPWMYECTIKTPATVVTKDGASLTVDSGHKWRLVLDDDTTVEFWLKKHRAWEQDSEAVTLSTTNPENYDLYGKLQQRLKSEAGSELVTRIQIQ